MIVPQQEAITIVDNGNGPMKGHHSLRLHFTRDTPSALDLDLFSLPFLNIVFYNLFFFNLKSARKKVKVKVKINM